MSRETQKRTSKISQHSVHITLEKSIFSGAKSRENASAQKNHPCNLSKKIAKRDAALLLLIYVISLLIAAIVSPHIYTFLLFISNRSGNAFLTYLAGKPFAKVFNRVLLLFLFIGYIPMLLRRRFLVRNSYAFKKCDASIFLRYFFYGVLLTAAMAVLQMQLCEWNWKQFYTVPLFCRTIVNAFFVAFLEEILFRGLLLSTLEGAFGVRIALPLCSAIFAHMHFSIASALPISSGISGSVAIAARAFMGNMGNFSIISYFSVFLFGMMLCMLAIENGRLLQSVALHGGVVFALLLYKRLVSHTLPLSALCGTNNLLDFMPCTALLLVFVICYGCCCHIWSKSS
jgi:membrane protease YdiL (CAAX protease family)